jgi:hypothetical protein
LDLGIVSGKDADNLEFEKLNRFGEGAITTM